MLDEYATSKRMNIVRKCGRRAEWPMACKEAQAAAKDG